MTTINTLIYEVPGTKQLEKAVSSFAIITDKRGTPISSGQNLMWAFRPNRFGPLQIQWNVWKNFASVPEKVLLRVDVQCIFSSPHLNFLFTFDDQGKISDTDLTGFLLRVKTYS